MFRSRLVMTVLIASLLGVVVPGAVAGAQAGGRFSVTVTYGGAPLGNILVIINSSATDNRGYINSGVPNITNGAGRYDLDLPAGTYDVHVAENGVNNATYPSQVLYELRVNAGQTVPVSFELQRPAGAISGIVRRANGTPVAGAQVDAFGTFALGDGPPYGWGGTNTAADGSFRLGNLLPNRSYAVFVAALGYRMDYVPVTAGSTTSNVDFPTPTGLYPGGLPAPAPVAPSPTSGPEGRMFAFTSNGTVRWYRHSDPAGGSYNWVGTNFGAEIGAGWAGFDQVLSGGNGVLYTVRNGVLRWYRNADPGGGSASWVGNNFGNVVGDGWSSIATIVPNGAGTIYAVRPNGELLWFRHLGVNDGTYTYAAGSANKIGDGFNQCARLFSGGGGVLYCVRANGDLQYWRHLAPTSGEAQWAGGNLIGSGWGTVAQIWSGGNGVIYTIDSAGNLRWYRHLGFADGSAAWLVPNFGNVIGDGWASVGTLLTAGLT